jgi:hypothetical protein
MSQWFLFAIGCAVFVSIVTATFLLGVAQFMRWEHEDEFDDVPDGAPARRRGND